MDGYRGTERGAAANDGLRVPERVIPIPRTISVEAQAFLTAMGTMPAATEPDSADIAAWRVHIEQTNQQIGAMSAQALAAFPAEIITHKLSATDLYEVVPSNLAKQNHKRAIFYIHGGAYIMGGGVIAAHMSLTLAGSAKMRAFAIDYRMPPDHPFPTGLDDTIEAYRHVLKHYDPANIAVHGASAGGGLAASFLLKARDLGLPLPGACVLLTPELDLTESGDTFETNAVIDVVLKSRLSNSIALYAGGHDLTDPYLSAIFGDFTKGFPPTLLTSGTRDLFLSNTVRMHRALRRAGVEADLYVGEAMPHGGFFGGAPEDGELMEEQVRFIDAHLGAG
jgi:monoterpene epsilon-lactone hydrolase